MHDISYAYCMCIYMHLPFADGNVMYYRLASNETLTRIHSVVRVQGIETSRLCPCNTVNTGQSLRVSIYALYRGTVQVATL